MDILRDNSDLPYLIDRCDAVAARCKELIQTIEPIRMALDHACEYFSRTEGVPYRGTIQKLKISEDLGIVVVEAIAFHNKVRGMEFLFSGDEEQYGLRFAKESPNRGEDIVFMNSPKNRYFSFDHYVRMGPQQTVRRLVLPGNSELHDAFVAKQADYERRGARVITLTPQIALERLDYLVNTVLGDEAVQEIDKAVVN